MTSIALILLLTIAFVVIFLDVAAAVGVVALFVVACFGVVVWVWLAEICACVRALANRRE